MAKITLRADNKWLKELEREFQEANTDVDFESFNDKYNAYQQYVKESYGFDLEVDSLGSYASLEMADKKATWFFLQHDGEVIEEENLYLKKAKH